MAEGELARYSCSGDANRPEPMSRPCCPKRDTCEEPLGRYVVPQCLGGPGEHAWSARVRGCTRVTTD